MPLSSLLAITAQLRRYHVFANVWESLARDVREREFGPPQHGGPPDKFHGITTHVFGEFAGYRYGRFVGLYRPHKLYELVKDDIRVEIWMHSGDHTICVYLSGMIVLTAGKYGTNYAAGYYMMSSGPYRDLVPRVVKIIKHTNPDDDARETFWKLARIFY